MTFNELKEFLNACPDHTWEVEEIWWPTTDFEGSAPVKFKIHKEEKVQHHENC